VKTLREDVHAVVDQFITACQVANAKR
jgi:hypothetical protein